MTSCQVQINRNHHKLYLIVAEGTRKEPRSISSRPWPLWYTWDVFSCYFLLARCMWRKPSYICLITHHNSGMLMSRLRSTATGGLVLTLAVWCYTHISGNVICNHAPHETCEFPCDCRFSNIVFLAFIKHHLVVSTSKTFVSFVSISDDCRRIPWLTGFQFFGFETNLSSCIALWRFC